MYTVTVYSEPLGGIAGPSRVFPDVLQAVDKEFRKAKGEVISDFVVTHIGDRVVSLFVCDSERVGDAEAIREAAYAEGKRIADSRKLFKNPSPASSFSLTFDERESESFILFMAGSETLSIWRELVSTASCASTQSIALCRTEGEFSSTAEVLERFADERANNSGVCPVSLCDSGVVRTKVTPVVALGFSMGNGLLIGPLDLFDTPLFDAARMRASEHITSSKNLKQKEKEESKKPFHITDEQKQSVISEYNVKITEFVRRINSLIQDDEIMKVSTNHILVWLSENGYLLKEAKASGGYRRVPSEKGELIGLSTEDRIAPDGNPYLACLYSSHAQKFILDNIENIINHIPDA